MDIVYLVLRLIHIFGGVFWAGTVFFIVLSILPTVSALGPDGGRFMQRLTQDGRMPTYLAATSGSTILAGLLLYMRDSGGFQPAWIGTGTGLSFTIGGLAGLVAFAFGLMNARVTARMDAVGRQIQAGGGPPKPPQLAEIQQLRARLASNATLTAAALAVALIGMVAARAFTA